MLLLNYLIKVIVNESWVVIEFCLKIYYFLAFGTMLRIVKLHSSTHLITKLL